MKAPAIIVLALASLLPFAHAVGYGTSSIALSSGNVGISVGGSATVNFTVNLSSGNAWGTTVEVANQRQLESDGIEISIGNAEGIPPYSGTLAIVSSSRSGYGTYNAIITVTGNDPSTSNAILGISVMPIITTTAAVTSVTTSLQSTAPTTIPPTTIAQRVSGAVSWTYFIAAVAAIIVILVLALILNRAGQTRRKKQPH